MKKIIKLIGCGLGCAVFATASMAADVNTQSGTADKSSKEVTQPGSQNPMSGEKFAKAAALGGMMEVETGKLAEQNGGSDAVKEFGKMMVTDHTKANEKLMAIAATQKIDLPSELGGNPKMTVEKLASLKGAEFDRMYVPAAVKDHEMTIVLFKDAAANCTDKELKEFAAATLPTLEMHLEHAQALEKKMAAN